jgi:chaperonin GroEL
MIKTLYGDDARRKLLSGVSLIARAVKVTLGPSGRNALIRNEFERRPFSTKDGVTVAGQIGSEDPFEMVAIESMQDIANNADMKAGDGTSTATILGEAILARGVEFPTHLNLLDIKRGIDEAVLIVVEQLHKRAVIIKDDDAKLKQVALIASNYDEECADIVFDAFQVAKNQGIARIARSRTYDTYLETIEGMVLPMGYRSRAFVNDYETDTAVLKEPYVFMTNTRVSDVSDNMDFLLSHIAEHDLSLMIICKEIDPHILAMLAEEAARKRINVCVCRAPGFGNEQEELLRDLGVILGKQPFIENEGLEFDKLAHEDIMGHIPQCLEITVGEQTTAFKEAFVDEAVASDIEKAIEGRANKLREEVINAKTPYEISLLQARISRLTDGIAAIFIGARSDTEYTEKQARIQDALYAIKAAYQEGVIPGGGAALLSLSKLDFDSKSGNESIAYGAEIVFKAIREPFFQILENVGINLNEEVIEECEREFNTGFDAKNRGVQLNMIDAGIMDPVKVTRVALENAASIAGMMLTTECLVVNTKSYNPHEE